MAPRRKSVKTTNAFAEALAFCSLVLKDIGSINETHVHIKDGWCTAFNGVLAIGARIDSDINICPQSKLAIEALSKCGQNIAITQLDNRLSIKSDKFKSIIPCIRSDLLSSAIPDQPLIEINDQLKEALTIAGELASEKGTEIYDVSVLLNGQSVISSMRGTFILEYWHGLNLPAGMSIPKSLCSTLSKISKKLTRFGYSQWSATFYFEDGSWIRSQLYADQWPSNSHIFDVKSDLKPFPADFFTGVAAVAPFGEGLIYFADGKLRSHNAEATGAEFELEGAKGSGAAWCYPAKQLMLLQPWAKVADFYAEGRLVAQGNCARAVIAGIKVAPTQDHIQRGKELDDGIPF